MEPTDKCQDEIEITPEMMEAGVAILVGRYDALGDLFDQISAAEIFKAMICFVRPSVLAAYRHTARRS
jgi:tRNA1(Val) A37 N6-methylase TrmN6